MSQGYTRIIPFLNDPKVSKISSLANKQILVTRSGRKLKTNVILNPEEINDIFSYISTQANIPIIDSAQKIELSNLTIEGLNTKNEKAGFTIHKKTAYSLLEKN